MGRGAGTSGEIGAVEGLAIALIDDDVLMRTLMRRVLDRAFAERGARVLEGRTGEEAIALRFGAPTPALLIVNGAMPGMHGPEAIAEIRRREMAEGLPRVPILFESTDLPDGTPAGADNSLRCPFNPADLIAAAGDLLAGSGRSGLTNRP
ncbi:MAG: response regulator [Candidatus Limnocylindrales bacterium]